MKPSLAGWAFAAPALTVIALFFVLPVIAALGLSVTDFDIYALADQRNLRFSFVKPERPGRVLLHHAAADSRGGTVSEGPARHDRRCAA